MVTDVFSRHDHEGCTSNALAAAEQAAGARLTPVRRRALEILLESHRAMGAYDILARLADEGFGKQPPVVYRALDFLVGLGLVHRVQRLNAFIACAHPAADHSPVFLICQGCDRVAETVAPGLRTALEGAAGQVSFQVQRATVEASGLCADCAAGAPA